MSCGNYPGDPTCDDDCCIICGKGDPTPESGEGAIPDKPDEDGHLDQW